MKHLVTNADPTGLINPESLEHHYFTSEEQAKKFLDRYTKPGEVWRLYELKLTRVNPRAHEPNNG